MLKNHLFYLAALFLLLSCSEEVTEIFETPQQVVGAEEVDHAQVVQPLSEVTEPVKLLRAWTVLDAYAGNSRYTRRFKVRVANVAFEKSVSIWHSKLDGNWEEIILDYTAQADDNYEIWEGQVITSTEVYADQFVIKYEVAGTTYWDNNFGSDYSMGELDGPFLGTGVDVLVDQDYTAFRDFGNVFFLDVDVRNIGYIKDIKAIYSTDGWNTVEELILSNTTLYQVGARQWVKSPNVHNIEKWRATTQVAPNVNAIDFAIVYKVNGQEIWDNNFGKNYRVTRK